MTTRRAFLGSAAAAVAAPMLNLGRFALPARSFGGQQSTYSARCIDLMKRALVIDMLASPAATRAASPTR